MSYIKSVDHFINYLNKVVRENPQIDTSKLLSANFYHEQIYQAGLADEFTWALRTEDPRLLEESRLLEWLSDQRTTFIREYDYHHMLTTEFIALLEDLSEIPGVYSFWTEEGTCLYVGKSIRLGQRILSSFKRFETYSRPVYAKYILTKSYADAGILELYYIAKLNPSYNVRDNYEGDQITLSIGEVPDWSDRVRCNMVILNEREGNDE